MAVIVFMRGRSARALLLGLLLATLVAGRAGAIEPEPGDAWVRGVIGRAAAILAARLAEPERRREFGRYLAEEAFDFDSIGRFVLGPVVGKAGEAEAAEARRVLVDYLMVAYARILRRVFDGTVDIAGARLVGDGVIAVGKDEVSDVQASAPFAEWEKIPDGGILTLQARFKPHQGEALRAQLRVLKRAGRLRIVDIWVNGVSLARTHRDDLASAARSQRGDLPATLDLIRKKTARLSAAD